MNIRRRLNRLEQQQAQAPPYRGTPEEFCAVLESLVAAADRGDPGPRERFGKRLEALSAPPFRLPEGLPR